MDPALYKAAMEGNIGVLRQHRDQLGHQLTPRNNTVLHVAAQFPNNTECVKEFLNLQPSLLLGVNSKGETALHIAARIGCDNTIRELLDFARTPNRVDLESETPVTKLLLGKTTFEDNDTALHEAVRNNSLGVVELLLGEDPDFSQVASSYEETPLYLAAEGHHHDIVSTILETCRNPAHGGPNGRTALHAAVIANCSSCVRKLLDKNQDLIKIGDSYGWMPLHFATRFNLVELIEQLLDADESIAYRATNDDDEMTALHLAAKWNSFGTMRKLWLRCPDCWEMITKRGQNVLHIAIQNENDQLIKHLLKSPFLVSNMLHEKDIDENTPLHLLATSYRNIPELLRHPAIGLSFNKKNQTPKDVMLSEYAYFNKVYFRELFKAKAPSGWRNLVPEDKDRLEKLKSLSKKIKENMDEKSTKAFDAIILVAALVATVTFAASFTVPGGFYNDRGPNQGMAVLVRKAAFKAFVISNTIAMTLSLSALILLLEASYYQTLSHFWLIKAFRRFSFGSNCLMVSLVAMMVSLITGSFAVLATSTGLAVAVCAIGCVCILIIWVSLCRTYHEIMVHADITFHKEPSYGLSPPKAVRRILRLFLRK